MVFGLWKRRKDLTPYTMYQSVMEQARQPAFFTHMGVPDTIEGRFDMLMVHAILALRRLKAIKGERAEEATDRTQDLADVLFKDLDRALRETGVGDPSMPKKMNKLAEAFFGRAKAFGTALDEKDHTALCDAVRRNTTGALGRDEKTSEGIQPATFDEQSLAFYMIEADNGLAAQSDEDVLLGSFSWPDLDISEEGRMTELARNAQN